MTLHRRTLLRFALGVVVSVSGAFVSAATADSAVSFTVAMPNPASHVFHVTCRVSGLAGESLDLKMPAWMPGFYRIMDYQRFVSNFRAADDAGRPLPWEKISRNGWRIVPAGAGTVVADYDVFGNTSFAANNFLDEKRAFIAPPGLFLYPDGKLKTPVTLTIELPAGWTRIGTGLDPAPGRPGAFTAPDFDTLYDCPILMGTQEALTFDVKGVPHTLVLEFIPETVDRTKIAADLKRIVEASTGLMEDIPYAHYTFLLIGKGNGGIEHSNSAAIFFNGERIGEKGYPGWLSYVAHEYFHLFNVKHIRPLALGPFDYDTENLTDMLWVSEGLTSYYQDIVLVRGGLETPEAYLAKLAGSISRFENGWGHHFQSATDSSLQAWGTGSGVGGDRNTTVSYYDSGSLVGTLLDLAIRTGSGNARSLDDVMRALYRTYDVGKKRGFTGAEFREECERAAGAPLAEVFEYASTTKDIEYAKYLAMAGLKIAGTAKDAPGGYLGLNVQTIEGKVIVTGATAGSPAAAAGFAPGDRIFEVNGTAATAKALSDALRAGKSGDRLKVKYGRGERTSETEVSLWRNVDMEYAITPVPDPSPLQSAILKDWLRKVF